MRVVRAVPDGKGRLSEGIVVEASVLGRVLGVRLLRLEASVVISPAEITEAPRPQAKLNGSHPPAGRHLADAVRLIDESAASLAASRRAPGN